MVADADKDRLSPETRLLRRIPPGWAKVKGGKLVPNSDNFSEDIGEDGNPEGTSVDVWTIPDHPNVTLKEHAGFGLVSITVKQVRDLGFNVILKPIDGNSHHALIVGRRSKSLQRQMAHLSEWVVPVEPAG